MLVLFSLIVFSTCNSDGSDSTATEEDLPEMLRLNR
jgi:hypothetical protein